MNGRACKALRKAMRVNEQPDPLMAASVRAAYRRAKKLWVTMPQSLRSVLLREIKDHPAYARP